MEIFTPERLEPFFANGLKDFSNYGIYMLSMQTARGALAFAVNLGDRDAVLAAASIGFVGESFTACGREWTLAEQTHENAVILRKVFPFTAPRAVLRENRSFGLGDRIGLAGAGQLRVFREYDALPVLAQQSVRELELTGRSLEEVLDCASFAAFREGFTRGFGADGDCLKTAEEVEYAVSCGCTMITLECSGDIRNDVQSMSLEQLRAAYRGNKEPEEKYIGKSFEVEGGRISFDEESFMRTSLICAGAVDRAVDIFKKCIEGREDRLDLEISVAAATFPTTPEQHFYMAKELTDRGVSPAAFAPRFIGEFHSGIDYIGDVAAFEEQLKLHAAIARKFGYKLSIHAGSDKLSVLASIGKYTKGHFHVKTSGTSWLEAMKIVAEHDPALYRKCHRSALDAAFAEAKEYRHVTADPTDIPSLDCLADEELPGLFDNDDVRQLIHTAYGHILNDPGLRQSLFDTWRTFRGEYDTALYAHIGAHLRLLYNGFYSFIFPNRKF
ncbi:MAG: tagaturonate epimerase family protein [Eubacteriales bacterium]|nr:tagaturonate epimerase family protein [Eubacteriales bacterium]